jgi:hypothetical protein
LAGVAESPFTLVENAGIPLAVEILTQPIKLPLGQAVLSFKQLDASGKGLGSGTV